MMVTYEIPGRPPLKLNHLVLDYNGTIAVDGSLLESVRRRILQLKEHLTIHVLTADTYGTVTAECRSLGVETETFPREGAALCKERIVKSLDGGTVCLGNGFNDIQMFDAADLSVAVLEGEGLCAGLLNHADVVAASVAGALDLLLKPERLRATLRT
jgi:P-type E1-E2 ATPase